MFCGLGEERTKIRKKKKEKKKEMNLIAAKSGLVGMKRYLKTYHIWNIFCRILAVFDWDGFLRQTCRAVFWF